MPANCPSDRCFVHAGVLTPAFFCPSRIALRLDAAEPRLGPAPVFRSREAQPPLRFATVAALARPTALRMGKDGIAPDPIPDPSPLNEGGPGAHRKAAHCRNNVCKFPGDGGI